MSNYYDGAEALKVAISLSNNLHTYTMEKIHEELYRIIELLRG